MGLAGLLLNFFNEGKQIGGSIYPYSLMDFVKHYPKYRAQFHDLASYCRKLENYHLLNHMGVVPCPNPFNGHSYYTAEAIYERDLGYYGSYDMLVEGFLSIRNRFKDAVLPVPIVNNSGDHGIGTSFLYDSKTLVTARHCVQGLKKMSILDSSNNPVEIDSVFYPVDPNLDIAVVGLSKSITGLKTITLEQKQEWQGSNDMDEINLHNHPSITVFAKHKVLDDVLTLGYPPIAGFENILIADRSSINSEFLRTSSGIVNGEGEKYREQIDYLLINAKVKSGNSGGPVFDTLGRVVGMVMEIPKDIKNYEELDKLGYGLVLPAKYLIETIKGAFKQDKTVVAAKVEAVGDGYFTVSD